MDNISTPLTTSTRGRKSASVSLFMKDIKQTNNITNYFDIQSSPKNPGNRLIKEIDMEHENSPSLKKPAPDDAFMITQKYEIVEEIALGSEALGLNSELLDDLNTVVERFN